MNTVWCTIEPAEKIAQLHDEWELASIKAANARADLETYVQEASRHYPFAKEEDMRQYIETALTFHAGVLASKS